MLVHKFYFFDGGVARCLRGGGELAERSPEFGHALESFIFHELRAYADYRLGRSGENLHYWRSQSGFEVDFILAHATAIEVKGGRSVCAQDLKGLRAISEESKFRHLVCVSLEAQRRVADGVEILPWRQFLDELWAGKMLD